MTKYFYKILFIILLFSQNTFSQYLPQFNWILFPDTNYLISGGGIINKEIGSVLALKKIDDKLYLLGSFNLTYDNKILNNIAWYGNNNELHNLNYGVNSDIGGTILKYNGYIVPVASSYGYYTNATDYDSSIRGFLKFNLITNKWEYLTYDCDLPDAFGIADGLVYHDTLVLVGGYGMIPGVNFAFVYNNNVIYDNDLETFNTNFDMTSCAVYKDELWIAIPELSIISKYIPATKSWTHNYKLVGGGIAGGGGYNFMKVDTFNNFLYTEAPHYFVGGLIDTLGGVYLDPNDTVNTGRIVYFDGFHWNPLGMERFDDGPPEFTSFHDIEFYRGYVFLAGGFTQITNNDTIRDFTVWDGEKWRKLFDSKSQNLFYTLEVYHDTLFIGADLSNSPINGDTTVGFLKFYMDSDTTCHYLKPRVLSEEYTYRLHNDSALINLYNNNDYAESWYWDFGDGNYGDTIQNTQHLYTDTGTYNVRVTVTHQGCTKTAERKIHILEELVSVKQNITKPVSFNVYPNPAKGGFNIDIEMPELSGATEYTIKVFSSTGLTMQTYFLHSGTNRFYVDAIKWYPGTYLCSLFGANTIIETKKIILK